MNPTNVTRPTGRMGLRGMAYLGLSLVAACGPDPGTCYGWRQTNRCSATGDREPWNDRGCGEPLSTGWSGYCECGGGNAGLNCNHPVVSCEAVCRAAFGGTSGGACSAGTCGGSSWRWVASQCS